MTEEIIYVSPEDAGVTDPIGKLNVYLVEERFIHHFPMYLYAVEEDGIVVIRDRDSDYEYRSENLTVEHLRNLKPIFGIPALQELAFVLMYEIAAQRILNCHSREDYYPLVYLGMHFYEHKIPLFVQIQADNKFSITDARTGFVKIEDMELIQDLKSICGLDPIKEAANIYCREFGLEEMPE